MAEEPKSRIAGLIGLITALTGLIAALVALSGALKPHLEDETSNAVAATTANASAPADRTAAVDPTSQRRLAGGSVSQSGAASAGQNAGGGLASVRQNVGRGAAPVDPGVDSSGRHETPAHAEAPSPSAEPDPDPNPATSDDGTPHETE